MEEKLKVQTLSVVNQSTDKLSQCCDCDKPININDKTNVIISQVRIYCAECYKNRFTKYCGKCSEAIGKEFIQYKNDRFHKNCFQCFKCNQTLDRKKFFTKADESYCIECFKGLFFIKCHECVQPIRRLSRCAELNGLHWHVECFNCMECHIPINENNCIKNYKGVFCKNCGF